MIAFIESNEELIGSEYEGKRVISLETYEREYTNYFILISPVRVNTIKQLLEKKGIYQYFELINCPAELQGVPYYDCYDKYLDTLNLEKIMDYLG